MLYHIVVGDEAAKPLSEAFADRENESVITLQDILHVGPLQKTEEGQTFTALRSAFWQNIIRDEKNPVQVPDMERVLELSREMHNEEKVQVWMWMAPSPADVCAYHWLLKYMEKYPGRYSLINIAGLPFLDAAGKLYYPKNFSEILPKEIIKARKLARAVTPAEYEVDGEEWRRLVADNAGIRVHEGGKKLSSKPETHYDNILLGFVSAQPVKASRIITQALGKHYLPVGDTYLLWRLKELAQSGGLTYSGDLNKGGKDFEVSLPDKSAATAAAEQSSAA